MLQNRFVRPQKIEACVECISLVQIFSIANMTIHIRLELRLDVGGASFFQRQSLPGYRAFPR